MIQYPPLEKSGIMELSQRDLIHDSADVPAMQVAITSTTNGDPVLPGGLYINDSNIAWETDTGKRIGHYIPENLNTDPASRGGQTVDGYLNEDQHFAVWMRIAQLSSFRKLYGRIDSGLSFNLTQSLP